MKKISVIIPCYQNEGSIAPLADRLMAVRALLADRAEMGFVFVNDGSTDGTLEAILQFKNRAPGLVKVVNLSRNFGSYNAFLAGMTHSEGDCHVHLHADLQEPPELIPDMFHHYLQGIKLVIAYRKDREDKEDVNMFASLYHYLVKRYAIRNVPKGGFDLMLFDDRIRNEVVAISEKNTNTVYLITWLGHPYAAIPYTRQKREHGKSQWTFWKNVKLFTDTFFSFSDFPLHVLRFACLFAILASLGAAGGLLFCSAGMMRVLGMLAAGIVICFSVSVWVIAEYILRIHETVRKRPNFVIDEII